MEEETIKKKKKEDEKNNKDYEEFLDDIVDEKDLRNNINLYKDNENIKKLKDEKLLSRKNRIKNEEIKINSKKD